MSTYEISSVLIPGLGEPERDDSMSAFSKRAGAVAWLVRKPAVP